MLTFGILLLTSVLARYVFRPLDPNYAEDKERDDYLKQVFAREKRERCEAEREAKRRG